MKEEEGLTPGQALRLIGRGLWRCFLVLVAFALFVLFAPTLWPNA